MQVRVGREETWREIPVTHGYPENSRGIGVADMAHALRLGRKHRVCGELAYHVLDIMHGFHDASNARAHVVMKSPCEQPAAVGIDEVF